MWSPICNIWFLPLVGSHMAVCEQQQRPPSFKYPALQAAGSMPKWLIEANSSSRRGGLSPGFFASTGRQCQRIAPTSSDLRPDNRPEDLVLTHPADVAIKRSAGNSDLDEFCSADGIAAFDVRVFEQSKISVCRD